MELTVTNRSQAYPKALKKAIGRVNKSENDIYNKLYVVLKVHKVPDLHKKTGTKEFEKYRREA